LDLFNSLQWACRFRFYGGSDGLRERDDGVVGVLDEVTGIEGIATFEELLEGAVD
jgi:hypothetical protein